MYDQCSLKCKFSYLAVYVAINMRSLCRVANSLNKYFHRKYNIPRSDGGGVVFIRGAVFSAEESPLSISHVPVGT